MEFLTSDMPSSEVFLSNIKRDFYLCTQFTNYYMGVAEKIDNGVPIIIALIISCLWYYRDWFWGLPPVFTKAVNILWWFNFFHIRLGVFGFPYPLAATIYVVMICLFWAARISLLMGGLVMVFLVAFIVLKVVCGVCRFSVPPAQKVCAAVGGCADAGNSFAEKLEQGYLDLQAKVMVRDMALDMGPIMAWKVAGIID
ncbi:hypothetical protein FANTH_13676 [Fusarium anthophilum]|uniref:Uncharacterized protein n=1 Tax=Fusarium anthophilum TaxID=48485 RepID=A0A8H5DPD9_9HYPO|nr:hypothetical protein FANTH_13676 [Fusarium anthophilum]